MHSYNIIGLSLIQKSPHDSLICYIIYFSYIHLWLAKWIVSMSKWLEEVVIIVFLTNLYEITVLSQLNTHFICDLTLCGLEKYPIFVYPNNCNFDSLK